MIAAFKFELRSHYPSSISTIHNKLNFSEVSCDSGSRLFFEAVDSASTQFALIEVEILWRFQHLVKRITEGQRRRTDITQLKARGNPTLTYEKPGHGIIPL